LKGTSQGVFDMFKRALPLLCLLFSTPAFAQVFTVTVTSGGAGYTSAPIVTATGGGCTTEPTFLATVAGLSVTAVTLATPGVGCTSAPILGFVGGGGAGAAATATLVTSPVPTLSVWGLLAFMVLLMGAGALFLERSRPGEGPA
jgi:hypothetical protein